MIYRNLITRIAQFSIGLCSIILVQPPINAAERARAPSKAVPIKASQQPARRSKYTAEQLKQFRNNANISFNRGEYAKAIQDLNRILEVEPYDAELEVRACCLQNIKQYAAALEDGNKLEELNPSDFVVRVSRSSILANLGRKKEAEEEMKMAVKYGYTPESLEILLKVQGSQMQHDPEGMLRLIRHQTVRFPRSEQFQYLLAYRCFENGLADEAKHAAIECSRIAAKYGTDWRQSKILLGKIAYQTHDIPATIQYCNEALTGFGNKRTHLNPSVIQEALLLRATCWAAQGKPNKSIEDVNTLIANHAPNPGYLTRLAQFHEQNHDVDGALAARTKMLHSGMDGWDVHKEKARLFLKSKKYSEALAELTSLINKDPKDHELYRDRALAYAQQGNVEAAINDYTKAISLEPKEARYLKERAQLFTKQGRADLAKKDATAAAALDKRSDERAMERLGF